MLFFRIDKRLNSFNNASTASTLFVQAQASHLEDNIEQLGLVGGFLDLPDLLNKYETQTNKQTSNQATKQAGRQAGKQASKHANKRTKEQQTSKQTINQTHKHTRCLSVQSLCTNAMLQRKMLYPMVLCCLALKRATSYGIPILVS